MVSNTLFCNAHILDSQNVYSRADGIADHYCPQPIFFPFTGCACLTPSLFALRPFDPEPIPLAPV